MKKRKKIIEAEKYRFKNYNPRAIYWFRLEKQRLYKILGKSVEITHIGSTAIKGLGGKGILDIAIACEKNKRENIKKKLGKNKYVFKPNWGNKNRLSFEKDYAYGGKTKRVHLHLVLKNSQEWKKPLKVIQILNKNPRLKGEYAKVKKRAAKTAKGEGKVYRKTKKVFLDKLERLK